MRYQRKWITAITVDNGIKKRKVMITKSVINIKKLENYNVIGHEKHFFKTKFSSNHKPNHYNPHRETSRHWDRSSLGLVQ